MKNFERILFTGIAFLGVCGFSLNTSAAELKLTDMHIIDGDRYEIEEDGITDSYGNVYEENVMLLDSEYHGYVSYDLNGAYKKVTGSLVASDETHSDAEISVGIFADGKEIYSISKYTRQQPKQDFEFDLSGVTTLDIKTFNANTGISSGYIYLIDTVFETEDSSEITPYEYSRLSDVFLIDSGHYDTGVDLAEDSYGNLHDGYIQFNAEYDSYAVYNLDGKYTSLKATLAAGNDTNSGSSMNVSIYCDDENVFSQEGITRQDPRNELDIDVTGVNVLKVQTSNNGGGYSSQNLYLYDDILE